jgi:hypothetical protein
MWVSAAGGPMVRICNVLVFSTLILAFESTRWDCARLKFIQPAHAGWVKIQAACLFCATEVKFQHLFDDSSGMMLLGPVTFP